MSSFETESRVWEDREKESVVFITSVALNRSRLDSREYRHILLDTFQTQNYLTMPSTFSHLSPLDPTLSHLDPTSFFAYNLKPEYRFSASAAEAAGRPWISYWIDSQVPTHHPDDPLQDHGIQNPNLDVMSLVYKADAGSLGIGEGGGASSSSAGDGGDNIGAGADANSHSLKNTKIFVCNTKDKIILAEKGKCAYLGSAAELRSIGGENLGAYRGGRGGSGGG